jgi:hypothetical protein
MCGPASSLCQVEYASSTGTWAPRNGQCIDVVLAVDAVRQDRKGRAKEVTYTVQANGDSTVTVDRLFLEADPSYYEVSGVLVLVCVDLNSLIVTKSLLLASSAHCSKLL